jgi:TolB-like protein/Flp pilus assembly protein TadD
MQDFRSSGAIVRFGAFELDEGAGELRRAGIKIRLQDQPLLILQILLEQPGKVVTREELRKRVWPSDTFVDFDHGINNAVKRLREALGDTAEIPRYIETLPRRGYRFVERIQSKDKGLRSVAVLPLENLSRDPEQEYFADGLTEALITSLAQISALRVVSRTTAMRYKGARRPLPEIARELGVEVVIEGTVLRSGERVRISAQLIEAASDTHLWAESYERDLRDVLQLQSEIARAVARGVETKMTPSEQEQLSRTATVDPEAYEAYLKGRYYLNKRSGEALKKSVEYFQRAIKKDPSYAPPYAALADCAGVAGFWSFASPMEGCGRSKAAALKALQIEDSAEAHASLGWATLHYDWDFFSAEREFQRAIQLNPRYATAHQWYGHCLGAMGRFDEAFTVLKHAIQLDPFSLIVATSYAGISWLGRRWNEAIDQTKKVLDLDPNYIAGRWALARSYDCLGSYEAAIACAQDAIRLSGDNLFFITDLGHAYAAAGQREEAVRILDQLKEASKQRYVDGCFLAQICAALNKTEEALRWLEMAYEQRASYIAYVKLDPWFDNLRSDSRFQDLLHRIHFGK